MKKVGDFWVPSIDALWGENLSKTKASYGDGGRGKQIGHLETALALMLQHEGLGTRARRQAVDAGANVGSWSRRLAEEYAVVHAFEPAPDTYECLARNVQDWDLDDKIKTYQNALSHISENVKVAARFGKRSTTRAVAGGGKIRAFPIDDFGLKDVGLLKIDVEGYEENVLRGAMSLLASSRPFVLMEVKPEQNRKYGEPMGSHDFLLDQGYVLIEKIGEAAIDWLYMPTGGLAVP